MFVLFLLSFEACLLFFYTFVIYVGGDHMNVSRAYIHTDASVLCGCQVLAVLDFGRDLWVQYEDWLDGMVMVGSGRKYRDSNTLQAQAFWYSAMLD